jgi:hypothetical protein
LVFKPTLMRGGVLRTILLVCALTAMGLRVVLPAGTMLGADADGRVTVTLCSGAQATIELGHGHSKPQPNHAPCAFASAAQAASAPTLASLEAPLAAYAIEVSVRPASAHVGQGLAAPPPPSTGPPLSA